jgi:transcription elongation GreA/GreB family factor
MTMKDVGVSPEFGTTLSRNELIRRAIEDGKVPMLPFEQRQLEVELLGHTATQNELSKLLGEAMTTTSETWHDNAQADAVTMQSGILVEQASGVLAALKNRVIIPYEHDEKDRVSIGALVHVFIGVHPETMLLTGQQRTLPDELLAVIDEDTTAVNIQSPIGTAIFDKPEGTVASYRVGERELQVTVVSIEYLDLVSILGQ